MDHPASGQTSGGTIEPITAPTQIANLLRRILENRAALMVFIPGQARSFVSALLEVSPASGELVIDGLNPAHGNESLLRAGRFHALASLRGVELGFACRLRKGDPKLGLHRAALPEVIHYRQRRAFFRADLAGQNVPIAIIPEEGARIEGVLRDISVGGIGAHLELHVVPPIEEGTIVHDCEMGLGPGELVSNPIEVRSIGFDGIPRRLRIGGRFIDLPPALQNAIQRYVLALQRQWLKGRRGR